jgi:hypothetical protein
MIPSPPVLLLLSTLIALPACGTANDSTSPNSDKADDSALGLDAGAEEELDEDGTFDDGSGIGCIFGDHLVSMARMADLDIDLSNTIEADSELTAIELSQVFAMTAESFVDGPTSLEQALEATDEASIDLLTVHDRAHERNFNMYIYSAGDNIVGRIYYSKSLRIAAEVGDGSIGECDAGFSNYDDLPWFYTN